ncbi:glycoside hydrolase [Dichotomocladium elegans]|nr:glycoside hydrolase [Dichotomocladium elegans]
MVSNPSESAAGSKEEPPRTSQASVTTSTAEDDNDKTLHRAFETKRIQHTEFTTLPQTDARRSQIVDAFLHAWNGYKKYAWAHDELKPVSTAHKDPFGGWGASLVDSLSTLWIMGLYDEFEAAIPEIEKLQFDQLDGKVSVFESIIRYLGGLLSAYELSDYKYPVLLQKADLLAQTLLPAFDTPYGLPTHEWNPVRAAAISNTTLVAEVGTIQLEFLTLSYHTGNTIYAEKAQAVTDFLDNAGYERGMYIPGLFPCGMDTQKGRFTDTTCSFGSMGDSLYEAQPNTYGDPYFLKEYIFTDGAYPQYKRLYTQSIDNMKRYMLQQVVGTKFLFLPPYDTRTKISRRHMDHLACFAPGMLAMGAKVLDRPEDMAVAKGLLEMCVYMYRSSATGLCPESWTATDIEPYNPLTYTLSRADIDNAHHWWRGDGHAQPPTLPQDSPIGAAAAAIIAPSSNEGTQERLGPAHKPRPAGLAPVDRRYLLRPETLESIFIMYRITGDPIYQAYGWEIFQALEKYCKTEAGYASLYNVDVASQGTNLYDSMESFLFAETFKYLYLLFSPADVISLDKYVFNTEAHPFVRRSWA